jgi:hypothetical protein
MSATFLSFAKNLNGGFTGEPLMAGRMVMTTISPRSQFGQAYGSLPVVIIINSRVVIFTFGGGGCTFRLFRAIASDPFLVLEDKIPKCRILRIVP